MQQAPRLGSSPLGGTAPQQPKAEPPGVQRLTDDERLAFDMLKPCAVLIVSTDNPVSLTVRRHVAAGTTEQRFGGNRGVRPARLVLSEARKDHASKDWDRSPFPGLEFGTQARIWCLSKDHAKLLIDAFGPWLRAKMEALGYNQETQLRHGCLDMGPDPQVMAWAQHALWRTGGANSDLIETWDDAELHDFLALGVKLAHKKGCDVDHLFRARLNDVLAAWAKQPRRRA
jgi:hypothetical protein